MCLDEEEEIDLEQQPDGKNYMCEECGHEMTQADIKYTNYKVGKITEVEEMKPPLKKVKVQITDNEEETVQIVTNAKHVAEGDMVVVACEGSIVPAGSETPENGGQGIIVSKCSVGGQASQAILCDGVMLDWVGGANGVLVKLEGVEIGGRPPMAKPRK